MSFFQRFVFTHIMSGIKTILPNVPGLEISLNRGLQYQCIRFSGNAVLLKGKDHYSLGQDAEKNETGSMSIRGWVSDTLVLIVLEAAGLCIRHYPKHLWVRFALEEILALCRIKLC